MAIPSSVWLICFRLWLALVGVTTIGWSSLVFPSFSASAALEEMSDRVLANVNDRFKPDDLKRVSSDAAPRWQIVPRPPAAARAEVVLRFRVAELAFEGGRSVEADHEIALVESKSKLALSVSPTDGLIWLTLYWLGILRGEYTAANLAYLERSYATAPFEGWLSLRRNRLGLAAFSTLDAPLQQKVLSEFASLLAAGFVDYAVNTIETVGWAQHDLLLNSLGGVDLLFREGLARQLARDGVRVDVPGVHLEDRAWR